MQSKGETQARKNAGKYSPPDVQAQAEEGTLDGPKDSGEDFGVMSARADSWADSTKPDRSAQFHCVACSICF